MMFFIAVDLLVKFVQFQWSEYDVHIPHFICCGWKLDWCIGGSNVQMSGMVSKCFTIF